MAQVNPFASGGLTNTLTAEAEKYVFQWAQEKYLALLLVAMDRLSKDASAADNAAISKATATNTGTVALATARPTRRGGTISNTGAADLYFGFASGVGSATGFKLLPGQSISLGYTGAIYVYCATSTTVEFVEAYD